jgi:hypothetical protein
MLQAPSLAHSLFDLHTMQSSEIARPLEQKSILLAHSLHPPARNGRDKIVLGCSQKTEILAGETATNSVEEASAQT